MLRVTPRLRKTSDVAVNEIGNCTHLYRSMFGPMQELRGEYNDSEHKPEL